MTPPPAKAPGPILVALGSDARTLRLVHAGFRLAREQGRPWLAVHVEVPHLETPEEAAQARVWLQEARELGAETAWTRSSSVVGGLQMEARRISASLLLLGKGTVRGPWDRLERARFREALQRGLGLRLVVLPLDAASPQRNSVRSLRDAAGVLAASAVILAICGIAATALSAVIGFPGIPALFALGVAFILHRWGRQASLLAIAMSLLAYQVCFAVPRFTIPVGDWTRPAYFLGSLVLVHAGMDLIERLHLETRAGRRREAETVLLMLLGRALARCATVQDVAEVLVRHVQSLFQADAWLLVPGPGDTWTRLPAAENAPPCPPPGSLLPAFGLVSREDPLEPLFQAPCTFLNLVGNRGTEGLLQLRRNPDRPFGQASWGSLQAFAVQGALALERVRWLEAAQRAHVESETERMRSSLLSAISHDLRTPLAAIHGAASSLLLPAEPLPEAVQRDMLAMIRDESERLAQLLSNLLDLTRLESGAIEVRKEWQPLDEVVGSVLRRIENAGGTGQVRVHLPADLPLVPLDQVLTEQLLTNLLVNARRYASETPVDLLAWLGEDSLELEVADRGPGIPPDLQERVFDKFFRMPGRNGDGGAGLGLAICDAIARAHGGRIWVEERPGGGASFRVSLPRIGNPPRNPDAEALPEEGAPCP